MVRKRKETEEVVQETVQENAQSVASLYHIDEFLATKRDLRPEIKAGFKVYMKGKSYQYSFQAFEKELENYLNRKLGGA